MTIDDQIRDEKLQYDINRKAAEISALSSGKIDKYEYLTGEEILPSNQQQIIEQAKFTYSPLGKAFEKQIKTIEDQGEKQIKAMQNQGPIKTIKKYALDDEDSPLISKQKEMFNALVDKRIKEINELNEKVNYDDLINKYKGNASEEKSNTYDQAFSLLDEIRDGKISLTNARNDQEKFRLDINEIKRGNKNINQKSKKTKYTILNCFTKQETVLLNFFDDYS